MRRLATLLMFMWLIAASCGAAEPPGRDDLSDPVFQRADLPEPVFLTAMAQDNNGFFWLGTQNGLFLWDGYRFHGVPVDPSRRDALADGFINVLHKDRQGRLWVGMAAGGLARLDPVTGKPVAVEIGPVGPNHTNVLSMCDDVRDGLWVGTAAGLGHVGSDGVASARGGASALEFAGQRVNAVVQDSSGTLWVGTGKGLFAASKPAAEFVRVPLPAQGDDAPTVTRLMIDGGGRLWIGTRSHGVFVMERGVRSARQVRDTEAGDRRLEGDSVRAMLDLGDGRIWVGTLGGGLVEVRPDFGSTRRIRHYQEVDPSLPKDEVYTLLRDIHGRVWVGTGEALSSHDPTQRGIATWFGIGGRAGRLGHPNVDVVLAMPDDSVWLGIGEGIEIIDFARGRVGQLEPDPRQPKTALPRARVLAMARGDDGSVYIGTQQGLYRADAAGRSVRRVEMAGRDVTAPAWALCASGDRLWLGDLQGLWEIRMAPGERAELMSHEQTVLGRSHVSSIACGDPRSLWVGTHAGLARYDKVRGTAEWLDADAPGQVGMPRGFITSVRTDARGRLWVSSYGGGLRVLEPGPTRQPVLHRIGADEGLVHNASNALLLDSRGDGWVSTDDGLARVAGDTLAVTQLHGANGVGIRSYWTNAAAVTSQGELVFGGVGGITVVRPEDAHLRRMGPGAAPAPPASAVLTAPIFLSTNRDPFVPAGTTLKPTQRSLQATFSLLDYAAPDRARYAYRLQGLEQAWSDSSPYSRTARYTNLPAGDYTLEVKAVDHAGRLMEAAWPVHVERAWHETAAARAAFAMATVLIAALVVRMRTRMLERRAAALGATVASRTKELQERTRQLEASHEAIRDLGAHNARALEEERKRVARELHDELGQQLAALNLEVGVMGARSSAGSVPQPEEWRELRNRVGRLTASMRRLVTDLRPIALDGGVDVALEWLAAEFTRNTGVDCRLSVDLGGRCLDADIAIVVFRVAQESLNNVRRHAQAREVRMLLEFVGDHWLLTVSDDGKGFDPTRRHAGYGLLGMEERAGLVGGSLEISAHPGTGTTVRLSLRGQPSPGAAPA
jgi:signal transduction histidine kinase/ligand-binding sensor domain-containing protein